MMVVRAGRKEAAGAASAGSVATPTGAGVRETGVGAARVLESMSVMGLSFLEICPPAVAGRRRTSDGQDRRELELRNGVDGADHIGPGRLEQGHAAPFLRERNSLHVAGAASAPHRAADRLAGR